MSKIRIVLDSNVILSAALFKGSTPRQALDKASITGQILMSNEIIEELTDIFNRPKFDRYSSKQLRNEFLNAFLAIVENVQIVEKIAACRDRKDDKFLELAVNGKANYIITGDQDLLVLNPFQDIEIISVSDYLSL
ncbi:MAG: putative toxin-antitoxin system toxin component, PIN family [Pseudanabaena sp.]|jgi:putative PIN family toxin of toxin-antitoxin system|uniref:putative toxin-antitoxin system toxin component, PIN family n=1 Tax=Pseudanabaena mucicola TaxID=71190 RepID=UPI002574B3D8|nr:putative toxin-antitoxin system toxin component, PIN family [Pseudanabaena mucicola]